MKIADMSVELIDHCGSDLTTVNAARVSFSKESMLEEEEFGTLEEAEKWGTPDWEYIWSDSFFGKYPSLRLKEQDVKLIHYLAKHKHKSPFNHAFLSFRVKAPIFVARQLVKHEYLPWNEVSRRYVDDEPEFWFPKEWRARADNVKQGSGCVIEDKFESLQAKAACQISLSVYNDLLKSVSPELARVILPQNTMTEWIWSGSLFAFMKMCKLRMDPHAQQESREVAEKIYAHIKELFPVSAEALMQNDISN